MFTHILGIEGPAHFNTRKDFFRESYRLLKPGGVLLLTDILITTKNFHRNWLKKKIGETCSTRWHMPLENWADAQEYRQHLEEAGFRVEFAKVIGGNVYPGFCSFNVKWASIKNAIRTRGVAVGFGLTFISWLLGYVYKKKMVDYIYVKAVK